MAVLAAVLIGATAYILTRPRPVWLVEEGFTRQWESILAFAPPSLFTRVIVLPEDGVLPPRQYGFIITRRGPDPAEQQSVAEMTGTGGTSLQVAPLTVYHGLADTGECRGALVLALDPWMVFRDYKDPAVSRSRVEAAGGGEGQLIVPGRAGEAVWAWTAQFLQSSPGVFPQDSAVWQAASERLFRDSRFQQGALTYGWIDAIPLFYRSSPAWVYAPLSRIRSLSPQDTGGLEANRFPEKPDWHEFGIQADILWAVPFGNERYVQKLKPAKTWLTDPRIQTTLANTLGWIPAHREGSPYNAASQAARLAWLSSSFVWQPAE